MVERKQQLRGDCSIRIGGIGFTADEIAVCAARQGLLSIEIELSTAAECSCADCFARPVPRQVMAPDEMSGLIDQARDLGAKRVILIDSVAAPYPHLRGLIEQLHGKQMEIELFAGGTLVDPELARFCNRVALDMGSRDVGIAFVDRLAMQATQFQTNGSTKFTARIFVTAENLEQIPEQWRHCRANGIDPQVQVAHQADSPRPEQIRLLFEQLAEIDRSEFNTAWGTQPALTGRSCKRHLFAVHISACGTVYACVGVTIPLGNIRTESLRDILTLSEVLEDLRGFGQKVKEPCRTCSKTTDCYGCRGSAYQLTGDYLSGDERCWKASGVEIQRLPVDVDRLIPHGPSIRMIDQLVQLGERRATTSFVVPESSPWIDENGALDELAYVEIIAQSFAATHGFHLTPEQLAAHKGLLLGITNLVISGESRAGDQLNIELRKVTRFGDFGILDGDVRHQDGRLIATGQVKVWRPAEAIPS